MRTRRPLVLCCLWTLTGRPCCCMSQRQRNRKPRPFAQPVAMRHDLAVVVFHDAEGNGQAETGPLPAATAREEWPEQVLHDFFGHAATVVLHHKYCFATLLCDRHSNRAARIHAVKAVG